MQYGSFPHGPAGQFQHIVPPCFQEPAQILRPLHRTITDLEAGARGGLVVLALLEDAQVAAGISEALVLTFEGVALSVPAIYLFALFKDRIATLSVDVQNLAGEYVRKIHTAYASRGTTPGSANP